MSVAATEPWALLFDDWAFRPMAVGLKRGNTVRMGRVSKCCIPAALCLLFALGAFVGAGLGAPGQAGVVKSVYDGDTLSLTDGRKIRLVQIDAPELGSGECYSRAAHRALLSLVSVGAHVTLEADPRLDQVDRYGRLLRYVRRNGLNVNLELVRRGAATPYFYRGDRGRYAALFLRAARTSRAEHVGLWRACPSTRLDPDRAADTGRSGPGPSAPPSPVSAPLPRTTVETPTTTAEVTTTPAPAPVVGNCAASYPTVCIAPPPPDLDCKDVPYRRFTVRWDVADPDPQGFDGDRDGIGCES